MYLHSILIAILLSNTYIVDTYHFERCLSCTEHGKIYLRPLYLHSNQTYLCVKDASEIPISSQIIVFSACINHDCLCVYQPSKSVVNKKTLCTNNRKEICDVFRNTSHSSLTGHCTIYLLLSFLLIA